MTKSSWSRIWLSYRRDASKYRLVKEVLQNASGGQKARSALSVALFIGALAWYAAGEQSIASMIAIVTTEIALLYFLDQMKSGAVGDASAFTDDSHHRSSRYKYFKLAIDSEGIGPEEVRRHIDLLQAEIDLVAAGSINSKRVAAFGVPLLVGLAVGLAVEVGDIRILLLAFAVALGVFIMAYVFASAVRTKEEALRELKTFMLLYLTESNRDSEASPEPQDNVAA